MVTGRDPQQRPSISTVEGPCASDTPVAPDSNPDRSGAEPVTVHAATQVTDGGGCTSILVQSSPVRLRKLCPCSSSPSSSKSASSTSDTNASRTTSAPIQFIYVGVLAEVLAFVGLGFEMPDNVNGLLGLATATTAAYLMVFVASSLVDVADPDFMWRIRMKRAPHLHSTSSRGAAQGSRGHCRAVPSLRPKRPASKARRTPHSAIAIPE